MAVPLEVPSPNGATSAAISNAVVHVFRDHLGKGPTRAKTYLHEDLITCLLRGGYNRQEETLVAAGHSDIVTGARHAVQGVMKADLIAAVERLTGRTVEAFVSGNHVDPELSLETFVLTPRDGGPPPEDVQG